ncbi:TraR/DksA C4-type zinc finger protein [Pueribacillus sp. YX66]|uniref:TraR/DksA C4-type zinc finger protein n=1 Tax=Pueribacillus sp. YX66 TaxID=3229242 RepID=UPI00358CF6B5
MSLSEQQLHEFQLTLLKMKKTIENRLDSSKEFGLKDELIKESTGELSNYDNHPADHATELFEREKDLALREHSTRELDEIERALAKIKEGTYGLCEECNREISVERLNAHPTALRCVEHSHDQTIAKHRPIEEEIVSPPFEEFANDSGSNTSFDAEDSWQAVASWGTSETPSDFFSNEKTDYNKMYMNADERIGSVDDIEGFLASDGYVMSRGVLENDEYDAYEEENRNE